MSISYKSHEFIKPEEMISTPPDYPALIIRVWFTSTERKDLGYIEWVVDNKIIDLLEGDKREAFIKSEIEVAIDAGITTLAA